MTHPPRSPEPTLPLTAFVTDAAVAGACDALSEIAGVRVTFREDRGRVIERTEGDPAWRILPTDRLSAAFTDAISNARSVFQSDDGMCIAAPVQIGGVPVGGFLIEHASDVDPLRRAAVDRCVRFLSTMIDEFCARELRLRRSNEDTALLYRLTSSLAAARDIETAASVALDHALDVIAAPAGAVLVRDPDLPNHVGLVASRGLDDAVAAAIHRVHVHSQQHQGARDAESTIHAMRAALHGALGDNAAGAALIEPLLSHGRTRGLIVVLPADRAAVAAHETGSLRAVCEQAAETLARIMLVDADRRNRRQLRLASQVQARMFPESLPALEGLSVAARAESCFDLGGDFYDAFEQDGNLSLALADVSGKGVPASLLMASLRGSLRAHARTIDDPAGVVAAVSDDLARDTHVHEFATLFFARIDADTRECRFCNAGHEPPLIVRPATQNTPLSMTALRRGGMIAGVFPDQDFKTGAVKLRPRDYLVAWTDGVTEARNFDGESFGRRRLLDTISRLISSSPEAPSRAVVDHLIWEVRRFVGLNAVADDITSIVVRVGGVTSDVDEAASLDQVSVGSV